MANTGVLALMTKDIKMATTYTIQIGLETLTGKTKIKTPDGKTLEAADVGFTVECDSQTTVKLDDGSTIQIRVVVTDVRRLEGIYDPVTGDPVYFVQSQPVISVKGNPELRKLQ